MLPVPFLHNDQVEERMEGQLKSSGLWPDDPEEFLDIEKFLTNHLKAGIDLDSSLPSDVLGEVIFRPGKKTCVIINQDLTWDAENSGQTWKRGRWRMTVAHESAHIILHGPLFLLNAGQGSLWEDVEPRVHRCYKRDSLHLDVQQNELSSSGLFNSTKQTDRMEIQANVGASALLMPRSVFHTAACSYLESLERRNVSLSGSQKCEIIVGQLAGKFQVSQQAARIRCKTLGIFSHVGQFTNYV